MHRSRLAEAALIGCLAALASFCALNASAGETYSIVAQSNRSSAATGRRPIAERIAAANLPIIAPESEQTASIPEADGAEAAPGPVAGASENMSVAAVPVDHEYAEIPPPAPRVVVKPAGAWPFGGGFSPRWPTSVTRAVSSITRAVLPADEVEDVEPPRPPVAAKQAKGATKVGGHAGRPDVRGRPAAGGTGPRQASTRPSGKGLSSSSPASVTR